MINVWVRGLPQRKRDQNMTEPGSAGCSMLYACVALGLQHAVCLCRVRARVRARVAVRAAICCMPV